MSLVILFRAARPRRKRRNLQQFLVAWIVIAPILGALGAALPARAIASKPHPTPPGMVLQVAPGSATRLHLDNFTLRYHDLHLSGVTGVIEVGSSGPEQIITFSDLAVSGIRFPGLSRRLSALPSPGKVSGSIGWNPETGQIRTNGAEISLPELGKFDLDLSRSKQQAFFEIFFSANRLRLETLLGYQDFFKSSLKFSGPVEISGRVRLQPTGDIAWHGRISIRRGTLRDATYRYGGENLAGHLTLAGTWRPLGGAGPVSADLQLTRGEALLDRFYFDLAQTPLALSLAGSWHPARKRLTLGRLRCQLKKIFTGNLTGTIDLRRPRPAAQLRLEVPPQPLANLLNTLVKDPFAEQLPTLQTTTWGGSWSSSLEIRGNYREPLLRGKLLLENAHLSSPERGIGLEGISGLLPIWIGPQAASGSTAATALPGHLEIEHLTTRLGTLRNLSLHFSAQPNRVMLTRPIQFPSSGKPLTVESLELAFAALQAFSGKALLTSDGFVLDSILADLLGTPVNATLVIRNGTVHLQGNRLRADGELVTRIFSGHLVLKNLRATDLFSLNRTLYLDADWRDLDLEQLTRTTHFGLVTGRLEGSLTGLAMSVWGPLAFDLVLKSQDLRGIRRRISVTAIDNLAQVGSGQSPFMGSAALLKLFKDFSYKKIGIRCTLKNNRFSIRGLMENKGVEYLVERRGLAGVDIVNRNPNNRISWNDMIERLKRIQHSGQPTNQ